MSLPKLEKIYNPSLIISGGEGHRHPRRQPEACDGRGAGELQGRDAGCGRVRQGRDLAESHQAAPNRCSQRLKLMFDELRPIGVVKG